MYAVADGSLPGPAPGAQRVPETNDEVVGKEDVRKEEPRKENGVQAAEPPLNPVPSEGLTALKPLPNQRPKRARPEPSPKPLQYEGSNPSTTLSSKSPQGKGSGPSPRPLRRLKPRPLQGMGSRPPQGRGAKPAIEIELPFGLRSPNPEIADAALRHFQGAAALRMKDIELSVSPV